MKDYDLHYTCSLIEYIGRITFNKRKDIVNTIGRDLLDKIYKSADVLHCEVIEKVADEIIEMAHISKGEFDNIGACEGVEPSYWDIGDVYERLISDVNEDDLIGTIISVYNSEYSDNLLQDYNNPTYYLPRDQIAWEYLNPDLL